LTGIAVNEAIDAATGWIPYQPVIKKAIQYGGTYVKNKFRDFMYKDNPLHKKMTGKSAYNAYAYQKH